MVHRPLVTSIRSRPRRPDRFACAARLRDARHPFIVMKWRIRCGRRPPLTIMFSISTRCCTRGPFSIVHATCWHIHRFRFPRSALFWRPGRRTRPPSHPVQVCARLPVSGHPSASTKSLKPSASLMAVPVIRRAASLTVYGRLQGRWQPSHFAGSLLRG
jgi:hypothetical protein